MFLYFDMKGIMLSLFGMVLSLFMLFHLFGGGVQVFVNCGCQVTPTEKSLHLLVVSD